MTRLFYLIKPYVPRRLQIVLRRRFVSIQRRRHTTVWPIDNSAVQPPAQWNGWPSQKKFAVVLTHDVESTIGQNRCKDLIAVEQRKGFKSSFNFVPELYPIAQHLLEFIRLQGFEVGIHGLYHDGKLFASKGKFLQRAVKINKYIAEWGAAGFRAPAMHHNIHWLRELTIQYDSSTFDTDPFEPQSDGVKTIFPFWVPGNSKLSGYVEMPYTLAQDFTLFILMKESNISLWKKKVDWIAEHGGMLLVNTHPDYIYFGSGLKKYSEYPVAYYLELLDYIKNNYSNDYWHALPKEVATFWREHVTNRANSAQSVVV